MKIRTQPLHFSALILLASCTAAPEPPPPDEVGVVRVPIILEDGLPWVDAKVGGRPVRLLLDLGGFDAVALIPEELMGLSVTWTGRAKTTFSAMGESARAREYVLRDFELGGVAFPEVRSFEDLLHGKQRSVSRSGYLGLGLLRRFRIIVDYESRLLVLIWPDAPPPADYDVENWAALEFGSNAEGILANAKLEGITRLLVWDTGASHCVLKKGLEGELPATMRGNNPFVTVSSFEVAGLQAGPMDFALLDFKEPRADGFVGTPFFARHAVYLDFRNRLLAVRP